MHCRIPCSQTEWLELAPCPPPLNSTYTRQNYTGFMTSEDRVNDTEAEKIMHRCSHRWEYLNETTITSTMTTTATTTRETETTPTTTKDAPKTIVTTNASIIVVPLVVSVVVAMLLSVVLILWFRCRKRENPFWKGKRHKYAKQTSTTSETWLVSQLDSYSFDGQKSNELKMKAAVYINSAFEVEVGKGENPNASRDQSLKRDTDNDNDNKVSCVNEDRRQNPSEFDKTSENHIHPKVVSKNINNKDDKKESSDRQLQHVGVEKTDTDREISAPDSNMDGTTNSQSEVTCQYT